MIKLDAGNVLLKPSHRRQMMNWLKRSSRLGERIGDFVLTLSMQRVGRQYEVRANVHDAAGDFDCRCRCSDWRNAVRDVTSALTSRLRHQRLNNHA